MDDLVLPDYDGRLHHQRRAGAARAARRASRRGCPPLLADADQVVLLVLDGLGWEQLQARRHLAPTLAAMEGGADHHRRAVAPPPPRSPRSPPGCRRASTAWSATASPCDGEVLNVLRWTTAAGDARQTHPAGEVPARRRRSAAQRPPVVTRAEFARVGLHRRPPRPASASLGLPHARHAGRPRSTGACARRRAVRLRLLRRPRQGGPRVRPRRALRRRARAGSTTSSPTCSRSCPAGAALVVTADHGQVDVGRRRRRAAAPTCSPTCSMQSGEGRFRWLHARAGRAAALRDAALDAHGDDAWVAPASRRSTRAGSGPRSPTRRSARLGDVPWSPGATWPSTTRTTPGPYELVGRHGSLTPAEMLRAAPRRARGRDGVTGRGRSSGRSWQDGRHVRPEQPADERRPTGAGEVPPRSSTPRWSRSATRPVATSRPRRSSSPAKVMRIGSMIKQLLEEVRQTDARRGRAATGCARSTRRRSPSCRRRCRPTCARSWAASPCRSRGEAAPSGAELRIAKAQLVGWLEGLFHGIQATLFAQQMAARQQLDDMRRRLPPGAPTPGGEVRAPPGHVPLTSRPGRSGGPRIR